MLLDRRQVCGAGQHLLGAACHQIAPQLRKPLRRSRHQKQLAPAASQLPLDFQCNTRRGAEDDDLFHACGHPCAPVTRRQNEDDIFGSM